MTNCTDGRIQFISKIHESGENCLSFYLPTKFVEWFGIEMKEQNNHIIIEYNEEGKESLVLTNVVFGKYRETYRGTFYKWHMKDWKKGEDYLITVYGIE